MPRWMWDVWNDGSFVGDNTPTTRATIARNVLKRRTGGYRSLLFFQRGVEQVEIPNIISIQIDRRLNTEAASMTMRIRNVGPLGVTDNLDQRHNHGDRVTGYGRTRRQLGDLGKPGILTFRRGVARDTDGINPWDHEDNEWVDLLIPNRVIYTFQGYGSDGAPNPAKDTRLRPTGVWLIDKVEFRSDGDINIQCRDTAKLLIEQRLYPPIVPLHHYPLEICADGEVLQDLPGDNIAQRVRFAGFQSSAQYVAGFDGSVYGHRYRDAFDGDLSTYWLSRGHAEQTGPTNFEWIQAQIGSAGAPLPIRRVRFYQMFNYILNGGYDNTYISVYGRPYVEGQDPPAPGEMSWLGSETIPYDPDQDWVDVNADIPYIHKIRYTPYDETWVSVDLDQRYEVSAVRITFSKMMLTSFTTPENPYPYKAGVAEFEVYDIFPQPVEVEGNINDYTDIVKLFCAWSGWFYHPQDGWRDPLLQEWADTEGAVWGDFFYSGAYPVDPFCIEPSYWDNKSVMDGINQIREILGFIFMVDSTGGVQWRPPNIWRTGNYIKGQGFAGAGSVRTVHENNVLIDYGVTIDDTNLRSDIIVVSADDPSLHASYQPGFAIGESEPGTAISDLALLGGQQRIMLVANYPFGQADDRYARAQVEKFAFLVSLWIHWSYRKSRFRIPGNPAFEVDDQIRIYERTTSELYVHYIEGYSSVMDMVNGTWTMDVDTHWLGNGPDAEWLIKASDMHPALFAYLREIGQIPEELSESEYPDDWFIWKPPDFDSDPISVPDEFDDLFPLPPGLDWPSETWSSETVPQFGDPTAGGTGGPPPTSGGSGGGSGGSGGGSLYNCSQGAKFTYWGSVGNGGMQTTVNFGSVSAQVDRRSVIAWFRLWQIMALEGWFPFQAGGYNPRKIAGTNVWSNHAWGLAVDFDWNALPYGRSAPVGHPSYRVAQRATNLRTNTGKKVFRWGGSWSTPDPMHFEVCCTPSDIRSGFA